MITSMRRGTLTFLLTLWQVANTAVRVFVWGTLRENVVDLRPLSRTVRLIGITALGLIVAFLIGLLFSDALRYGSALTLLPNDSSSTRGLTVPSVVIPLTLVAIAIGWGYILAGALHTRPLVRWLVIAAFTFQLLFPIAVQSAALSGTIVVSVLGVALALMVCFVLFPRVALPLPFEWSVVLGLCSALLVLMMYGSLRIERLSGAAWLGDIVSSLIQSQFILIMPFLAISGLGWADFALEASSWVAQSANRHARGAILIAILLGLIAYRLYGVVTGLGDMPTDEQARAWAGAAILIAGLIVIGVVRRRAAQGGQVPVRLVTMLALVLPAIQIALIAATQLAGLPLLLRLSPEAAREFSRINEAIVGFSNLEYRIRPLLLAAIGLVIGWVGRRRAHATLSTFGLILAWTQFCRWLTSVDGPVNMLRFNYSDVDTLALFGIAALCVWFLVRRRLTQDRALRLLAVVVLLAALNQTDFLDNPFSPFFGFAGVAFLAFAVLWSLLTAGNGFANNDSPGMPRESRLLMYLGYVLLAVSTSYWYFASHNIGMQDRQNLINTFGFITIGLPMAYLAVVELGEPLLREDDGQV